MTAQLQVLGIFEGLLKTYGSYKSIKALRKSVLAVLYKLLFVWEKNVVFSVKSLLYLLKKGVLWKNLYAFSVNYDAALTKAQKR